jgi:hypothetical protein
MTFPWMWTWKMADGQRPGACCVNNAAYRAHLAETTASALEAGASGVQFDDWSPNGSLISNTSECFCDFCPRKFREATRADSDYRRFLKTQRHIANAQDYLAYRKRPAHHHPRAPDLGHC